MAQKLNKKVVALIVCVPVAIGLAGGGYVMAKKMHLFSPGVSTLEKSGDEAWAAGDYVKAKDLYGAAANRAKNNIALQNKFVNAFDYCVNGEPEAFRQLQIYYSAIHTQDARNLENLRNMLRIQTREMRMNASAPSYVKALKATCDAILEQVPGDREARRGKLVSVIEPLQRSFIVDPADYQNALAEVDKLYEEDPNDGETIFLKVRFILQQIQDTVSQNDPKLFRDRLDAAKKFADDAVAKRPENADANFAAYHIYTRIFHVPSKEITPEKKMEMMKMADSFLEKADQYATPSMNIDSFLNIRSFYIHYIELRDRKKANERYKQFVAELPNSRIPRIMYAKFLSQDPETIEDAITLLNAPFKIAKAVHATESMDLRNQEVFETLRLQVIRLTSIERIRDEAKQQARLAEVEKALGILKTYPNIPAAWMNRIEAGVAMQHNRISEAVSKLEDAITLIPPNAPSSAENELYNELLEEDAVAQSMLGQTGIARRRLKELVLERDPLNIRAKFRYLDVLIRERDRAEARKQFDELKLMVPSSPLLARYEPVIIALFPEEIESRFNSIKEDTRDHKLLKMKVASSMGAAKIDEAVRIGRELVAADAKDAEAVQILFQALLIGKGDRDSARAVIDDAIKSDPENKQYVRIRDAMDVPPEKQKDYLETQFSNIEDPYSRAMYTTTFYRDNGKYEEALAQAREAEKLRPESVEAMDMEFSILVKMKRFTDADNMLEKFDKVGGDPAGNDMRKVRLKLAKAFDNADESEQRTMLADAKRDAGAAAKKYRDISAVTLLYAQLLASTGEYPEAIEQYQQTLLGSPTNLDALTGLIECYVKSNRINEAALKLKESTEKFPNNRELRNIKQNFEISFGDPEMVLDDIKKNLTDNNNNPAEWMRYGSALEQVGRRKLQSKDEKNAAIFFTRASKHWEQAQAKFPGDIRFPLHSASMKAILGDNKGAESALKDFIAIPANAGVPEAYEALADLYLQIGRRDDAEKLLKDFVTKTPNPPASTLRKISTIYIQAGKAEEALAILDLNKDDPQIITQRTELLIANNKLDEARQILDREIAKKPTAELYLQRGFVEFRAANYPLATDYFNKTLQLHPKDVSALFYRAQIVMNQVPPNLEAAQDDLRAALEAEPNNINLQLGMADVQIKLGDRSSAIASLDRAWNLSNHTNKEVYLRLFTAYLESVPPRTLDAQRLEDSIKDLTAMTSDPDVILASARRAMISGDTNKTIALADKALEASGNSAIVLKKYFDLLYDAKQFKLVLDRSQPIVQKNAQAWWLYQLRGQAYRAIEQRGEAGKAFDMAMAPLVKNHDVGSIYSLCYAITDALGVQEAIKRIAPIVGSDNDYRLLLATLYQRSNEFDKSIEILQRIRSEKSTVSPALYRDAMNLLGTTCLQVFPKQAAESRAVYEELLQITPDDVLLLNNLSYVHIMEGSGGSLDKALAYSAKAYELSRTMPASDIRVKYVEDTRGWVLYKAKKVNDAMEMLLTAAVRAKFPDVHVHLAEIYINQQDFTSAQKSLKTAGEVIAQMEKDRREVDKEVKGHYEELKDIVDAKVKTSENGIK